MCDQQSLRSACAYTQSDQSLCKSLEYSMTVKLLTKHHWEFLSLKGGCTGLSESTLVKKPHSGGNNMSRLKCVQNFRTFIIVSFIIIRPGPEKTWCLHGVLTKLDSNQPVQLQRLARKL